MTRAVKESPGFYLGMRPIDGAVAALHEMLSAGLEPVICSTPLPNAPYCMWEKEQWVKLHLGYKFYRRLEFTADKTRVRGRVLIDDKPKISGLLHPTWEHVIFDTEYNRHVTGKRRLTNWRDWRDIVLA